MFKSVFAVDIGSKNTRYACAGGCGSEPTLIAITAGQSLRVQAVGLNAQAASGSRLNPMRDGAAANTRLVALFLSHLAAEKAGRRTAQAVELYLALPKVMPAMKQNSFIRAAKLGGFRGARILNSSLMGAIGAGMDVFSERAGMLVDIGAGTVRTAVIANGGLLFESLDATGSSVIDRAIQTHLRTKRRIIIGSRMAELIKENLGRLSFMIDGRSVDDGLPRSTRLGGEEAAEVVNAASAGLIRLAADSIRAIQPDAAADLLDSGITLIGGGARVNGLAERFRAELGVPIRVADNAETAVADGMREYLFENRKKYSMLRSEFVDASQEGRKPEEFEAAYM